MTDFVLVHGGYHTGWCWERLVPHLEEDPRVGSVQSDMMFTLPLGGWDNSPVDDTQLPDDLVIDYVRVWQRRDLIQP